MLKQTRSIKFAGRVIGKVAWEPSRSPTWLPFALCLGVLLLVGSVWEFCLSGGALSVLAAEEPEASRPKKILLIGQGPDGHPPNTHEYRAGMRILAATLRDQPNLSLHVVSADGEWPEGPALIREADGVVLFVSQGARWVHADPRRLEAFAQLAARGGGLTTLHWGMGTKEARYIEGFVKLFGGCHGGPDRKYQVLDNAAVQVAGQHPITRGVEDFKIRDEFYYRLKFIDAEPSIASLLTTPIDGERETIAWAWERVDGGGSFGFSGGHFHQNWRRAEYRRLMAQGVLWTVGHPIPAGGIEVDVPEDIFEPRGGPPD